MITLLLAPLALAVAPQLAPASMVTTGLHRWQRIAGKRLRADRVVEDSRCPMNARCVWAGRATVRVTLNDGKRTRTANVALGESIPFAGGQLALVSVSPEKMAGAQPKRPAPYRFTFEYRR
jgi:hypothetical protein